MIGIYDTNLFLQKNPIIGGSFAERDSFICGTRFKPMIPLSRITFTHLCNIILQKSTIISGSFTTNDLQFEAFYMFLPPCTNIPHAVYTHAPSTILYSVSGICSSIFIQGVRNVFYIYTQDLLLPSHSTHECTK